MPFLYGNHVLKAHLGRITEDTPEHQGVVLYSMNDVPLVIGFCTCFMCRPQCSFVQGFGVTSKSTVDTRKLDPTAIVVFHQAYVFLITFTLPPLKPSLYLRDVGEYLRDEVIRISRKLLPTNSFTCRIPCSDPCSGALLNKNTSAALRNREGGE